MSISKRKSSKYGISQKSVFWESVCVLRHVVPHFQFVELMKVHSVFTMAHRAIDVCTRRMLAVLKHNHCNVCYITATKYVPHVLHSAFLYPQIDKCYSSKYTLFRLTQHFTVFSTLYILYKT